MIFPISKTEIDLLTRISVECVSSELEKAGYKMKFNATSQHFTDAIDVAVRGFGFTRGEALRFLEEHFEDVLKLSGLVEAKDINEIILNMGDISAFSKTEIDLLARISAECAYSELKKAGYKMKLNVGSQKLTNAIDIAVRGFGFTYGEAVDVLTELFPEVPKLIGLVETKDIDEIILDMVDDSREKDVSCYYYSPPDFGWHITKQLIEWWKTFLIESIDLFVKIPDDILAEKNKVKPLKEAAIKLALNDEGPCYLEDYGYRTVRHYAYKAGYFDNIPDRYTGITNMRRENQSLCDLVRLIPALLRRNEAGKDSVLNKRTIISCRIHWPKGKIGIPIYNFHYGHFDKSKNNPAAGEFLEKYPPTAILVTSDMYPQVVYVIDEKYEKEFYDYLIKELNNEFGDPNMSIFDHSTKITDFFNRKTYAPLHREKRPLAEITKSTISYPRAFDAYVDSVFEKWSTEQDEKRFIEQL